MTQHHPKYCRVPLELARASMAYLDKRPHNETVGLMIGWGDVVVEWEERERARISGQSSEGRTGAPSASTGGGTPSGIATEARDRTTSPGSITPFREQTLPSGDTRGTSRAAPSN